MECLTPKKCDLPEKLEIFRELSREFSLVRMNGKKPIEKGWHKYCHDRREFDEIGFRPSDNAGIACGPASRIVVLDIDDQEIFNKVASKSGWEIGLTYTVQTGSGNLHHYFRYPQGGKRYGNKTFKKLGFDIKGLGGVIVAPGSLHPDTGEAYTILRDVSIADPPNWLLDLYKGSKSMDCGLDEDIKPVADAGNKHKKLNNKNNFTLLKIVKESGIEMRHQNGKYVGLCPFHEEKNPSFFVFPDGYFKCFGCGAYGDKIDFVQKRYGITFKEGMVNDRVDSPSFFHGREFIPAQLADYISGQHNIFHDRDSFYIYDQGKGVWVEQNDNVIGKLMKDALGPKAKTSRIRDAMKLLEMDTFRDPKKTKDIPMIINLSNGMLNIKTRELLPHDKSYYSTVQIPIEYDQDAKCPKFDRYLDEIFADDLEKIDAIQEFAGYCLYPGIFIHKCLFLIGGGANGKSIFINTLIKIVGEQNISALELHQLSDKFLIGTLKNKLLNASSEVQTKKQVNASIFKQVVAGDLIQADKKHKQPFTFRPIAKHIFSMNEIPVLTDRTYAFERRLIVITFNQTFSGKKEDKKLEEKLESELSGILIWCLEGLSAV